MKNLKWQEDVPFIDWLISKNYAEIKDGKVQPHTSLGLVLYMHEAYRAGLNQRGGPRGTLLS